MGTKNNPGTYDCYANAEPDEPLFILRGSDKTAALVVTFWRALKLTMREQGTSQISDEKLLEATECSLAMEKWARDQGKDPKEALVAMEKLIQRMKGEVPPLRLDNGDVAVPVVWPVGEEE